MSNISHSVLRWQPVILSVLSVEGKEAVRLAPLGSISGQNISSTVFILAACLLDSAHILSVFVHVCKSMHMQIFVCSNPLRVLQPSGFFCHFLCV